jgi:hypothetical protein
VRVEFSGYGPIQDQEFNSFTFAAVGSGTRASYLESLAGLDDSYEFFGGGFDLDHLVAFETPTMCSTCPRASRDASSSSSHNRRRS